MFKERHIECFSRKELDRVVEETFELCMSTDMPLRVTGHHSPEKSGGNGHGGIMISVFADTEYMHHITAKFPIGRNIFKIDRKLRERLLLAGKVVCFNDWEEKLVTHVMSIQWPPRIAHQYWEYGFIGKDDDAIIMMMKYGASKIRKTNNLVD